jgi:hypothetical protein
MKIIYLLNARIPTEKAHGYQSMKTCEALVSEGCNVEVWVPFRRQFNKSLYMSAGQFYDLKQELDIKTTFGLDWIWFANQLPDWWAKLFIHYAALLNSFVFFVGVLVKLLTIEKQVVFYTRDHNLIAFLALFFTKKLKENFFIEMHSLSSSNAKIRRQFKIFRKVSGVITVTQTMKDILLEAGFSEESVFVEADAVDLGVFSGVVSKSNARKALSLPQKDKIISFVGNFHTKGN